MIDETERAPARHVIRGPVVANIEHLPGDYDASYVEEQWVKHYDRYQPCKYCGEPVDTFVKQRAANYRPVIPFCNTACERYHREATS